MKPLPRLSLLLWTLFVGVTIASGANAQRVVPVSIDSVDRLNREGHWQAALTLARTSVNVPPADACALEIGIAWALDQMGRYDSAADLLPSIDSDCGAPEAAAVLATRRERLEHVRRDVRPPALPALPAAGLDVSGIRAFWQVVDTLQHDAEPSDSLWHSMFATPGFRLSFTNVQPLREDLEISYRPSRRAERDSLMVGPSDQAARLKHFARALADRAALNSFVDSLSGALPISAAVALAQAYLPPGATADRAAPLVTLAIFRDDAYSAGAVGIVVDALRARDADITRLLAHEFHHSYIGLVTTVNRPPSTSYDAPMMSALFNLRNEGSADQIDKPFPLPPSGDAMVAYTKRYNEEYLKTPATLRAADSSLAAIAAMIETSPVDSIAVRSAGQRLQNLFFSSGHPNGAYMMRTIVQTFGMDSMYAAERNPFAFFRIYEAAARKRGEPPVWSPVTRALLDAEERRWAKP